jgi:putative peptide zinc metalloprotease protein
LLINLSPCMRFDGYFLLMDALDMPNLHARAFATARWWLREVLFDLREAQPEAFSPRATRWLVAFAFAVWAYRLALFLGIAALVYHFFIKVVGVGLFAVEMGFFVIMPFAMEFREWRRRGAVLRRRRRTLFSLAGATLLLLVAVLPWHAHITAPALLKAPSTAGLYAVSGARLVRVLAHQGQAVTAGQPLILLESPDLRDAQAKVAARLVSLRYEREAAGFDTDFRERTGVLREEQASALAEQDGIAAETQRLTMAAPFDGVVTDVLPDLHPGDWVSPHDRLATVKALSGEAVIEAYVDEDDLSRIAVGDLASFLPEASGRESRPARVVGIDSSPVRLLADPELAKPNGGDIAVRGKAQELTPDGAVYRVYLSAGDDAVPAQLRGRVRIEGKAESFAARSARAVMAVILREWGA